jgi:hypothetical protein
MVIGDVPGGLCEIQENPCESSLSMHDLTNAPSPNVVSEQAVELSLLIDLEARWENLRTTSSSSQDPPQTTRNLHDKQKAYEAFSVKLKDYNKIYEPPHIPELLLNTPARLGIWCRAIRKVYVSVEHDPRGHCSLHLMEKAYRWADLVANKKSVVRFTPSIPITTIGAIIRELEALSQWCDKMPFPPDVTPLV